MYVSHALMYTAMYAISDIRYHYSSSNCFWILFGMTDQLLLVYPTVHPLVRVPAVDNGFDSPSVFLPHALCLSQFALVYFAVVSLLHLLANSLYSTLQ